MDVLDTVCARRDGLSSGQSACPSRKSLYRARVVSHVSLFLETRGGGLPCVPRNPAPPSNAALAMGMPPNADNIIARCVINSLIRLFGPGAARVTSDFN